MKIRISLLLLSSFANTAAGQHGAGAGADVGDPLFFDEPDYDLARSANNSTFAATIKGAGWSNGKTESASPNRSWGYIYTVVSADVPGPCGTFPTSSTRAMMLEGRPGTHPGYPGAEGQTDHYLQFGASPGAIPANAWYQMWMCVVDSGAMTSEFAVRNKFIYANNDISYPAVNGNPDFETYDVLMGFTGCEEWNPANRSWNFSTAPRNRAYLCNEAFGAVNTLQNDAPSGGEMLYHNLSPRTYLATNEWTLVKIHVDISGPQGVYEAWLRPYGEAWVKVSEFRGGVTRGFTWPTTRQQRIGPATMRMPTTENSWNRVRPGTDGDNWKAIQHFAIADTEIDLPTYADDPD